VKACVNPDHLEAITHADHAAHHHRERVNRVEEVPS
jgi:hypothetical protein